MNLDGAIALTGHVLILRQDCPHCGKQTLCKINTLHGHARCLECGGQVHERERGVGGATDEGSLADITQEGHSQKKDSRKEVSREEDGETLGSMAARSPWKSFGRNWKLGGTSSAVEKVSAPCAGLIAGKIAFPRRKHNLSALSGAGLPTESSLQSHYSPRCALEVFSRSFCGRTYSRKARSFSWRLCAWIAASRAPSIDACVMCPARRECPV